MTLGLKQLHMQNVLHRDLKSANIFLSSDFTHAKIGDLNVSKVAKMGLLYTQVILIKIKIDMIYLFIIL